MDNRNVNVRDLQQLTDAIAQTIHAIQRITPQLAGSLLHSAYVQQAIGISPDLAQSALGVRSNLEHAALASALATNPLYAQAALAGGLAHSAFAPTGVNPFVNAAVNPFANAAGVNPFVNAGLAGLQQIPVRLF